MLDRIDEQKLNRLGSDDISDSLERGSIVNFPDLPVGLPRSEDLIFLRQELPGLLKLINVSYHPEAGACGATNGDRILRFFINVNPADVRVWVSKGKFPKLPQVHGECARLAYGSAGSNYLPRGPLDHAGTGADQPVTPGCPRPLNPGAL